MAVPEVGQVLKRFFASIKAHRHCVTYCKPMTSPSKHKNVCYALWSDKSALYIQENSLQLGNLAAGANKALPSAKKASKKDSRPTCLDGLWEILQHAEELLQSQPDVMAHTLRLLAVMWQVLFPLPPCQPSMFLAESSASIAPLI